MERGRGSGETLGDAQPPGQETIDVRLLVDLLGDGLAGAVPGLRLDPHQDGRVAAPVAACRRAPNFLAIPGDTRSSVSAVVISVAG